MRIRTLFRTIFVLTITMTSAMAKDDYGDLFANIDLSEIEETTNTATNTTPMLLPERMAATPKLTVTRPEFEQASSTPQIKNNVFVKENAQVNYTESSNPGCATDSCSSQGGCGCKESCLHGHCVPHTQPNLPISTLRQYFKSDACNSRIWDGYRNRCGWSSKHTNGQYDCATQKKRSCVSGCGEVVASGCDTEHRLPESWVNRPTSGCELAVPAGCDDSGSMSCDTYINR